MHLLFKRSWFYLLLSLATLPLLLIPWRSSRSQDWFSIGINLGTARVKMAVADFPASAGDPNLAGLTQEFNEVLWNDLHEAGIFDLVSKSFYPLTPVREPQDVDFKTWSSAPVSAQMLAFGKTEVINSNLVITGRLFDLGNAANPSVVAKRYVSALNEVSAREAAHHFANEIIQALGGGLPGICLTKIAYVSGRPGRSEIWVMDYDGANPHPITNYGTLTLTPRWSPDNTKLAFTTYASGNPRDSHLFAGDQPPRPLSQLQRAQHHAGLVAGRKEDRFLFQHERRPGALPLGCQRPQPATAHLFAGSGYFTGLEPQDGQ